MESETSTSSRSWGSSSFLESEDSANLSGPTEENSTSCNLLPQNDTLRNGGHEEFLIRKPVLKRRRAIVPGCPAFIDILTVGLEHSSVSEDASVDQRLGMLDDQMPSKRTR
mmetsp:Transcript_15151/g.37907  ORF Transcript_15151/g.37907 Transcript_15151/m.37907 type:complete len:111 (+) Transcript_15151:228-560(+)